MERYLSNWSCDDYTRIKVATLWPREVKISSKTPQITPKSINIKPVVVHWGGIWVMCVPEVCQNIYPATPHPQTHPTLLWLWLVKSFLWLPYCLIELVAHPVIVNREKWVDNFKSQLIKSWLGWSGEPESLLIEIDVTMSDYFFQCQEWMVVLEV